MNLLKRKLRELRVAARRLFGREPRVIPTVKVPLEYHGRPDSGWCIAADSLNRESVVVDVGLGEDVTFSESVIAKYGSVVYGFDPTPRAIEFVKRRASPSIRLYESGLGAERGTATLHLPNNPAHVSGSVSREAHLGRETVAVKLITIGDLFGLLECDRIDLLKLDIEGAEYDVIGSSDFHMSANRIGQLCVEFHHRWATRGRESTIAAVETLEALGFGCAWYSRSTNEEFLFVQQRLLRR